MKNKKGFTLIELLAVIVILGIITSISVVSVNSIKKKQDEENRKNVISSILTGAKRYVADHPERLNFSSDVTISVSELLENEKYVDFDQNKYSDLVKDNNDDSKIVSISQCSSGSIKLKYSFTDPADGKTYNDCGCQSQPANSTTVADKLCIG